MSAADLQAMIGSRSRVHEILNRKRPGDTVTITLYRGAKKLDVPVKLGERDGN